MKSYARLADSPVIVLLVVASWFIALSPARAQDPIIDSLEFTDPNIPVAKLVKVFPERLTSLWIQALARPEDDFKCQAAACIALAHQRGMTDLESTLAPLQQALDQPGQHASVRLAAAQSLIALDARPAAASLFAHAQADGSDMRNLVEPALAQWKFAPAGTVWLQRLAQVDQPELAMLLAIRGLSNLGEVKAIPKLRELALAPAGDPIIRLEAATALGNLQTTGLEKDAELLAAEKAAAGGSAHLAAAALLRKHRGDAAVKILQRLAVDAEPAAAVKALDALLENDPRLIMELMQRVLSSPAAMVRARGVEAFRRYPKAEHLALIAERLDDVHPQVRTSARQALVVVAQKPEFGEAIRAHGTRLLAGDHWRALEQATFLLASLDFKPAAKRMVELLRFERPEVFVAAAWGLRKLAVPATLPDQVREIERHWQQSTGPNAKYKDMRDHQLAQLCQSLGQARYAPAVPVLSRFIPKQVLGIFGKHSRIGAIWALGLIAQKAPPQRLVRDLISRLTDEAMMMPEDLGVRRMSAIALGRMKAEQAVDGLSKYYSKELMRDPFPNACGWALEQITGEKLPATGIAKVTQRGWFLDVLQ